MQATNQGAPSPFPSPSSENLLTILVEAGALSSAKLQTGLETANALGIPTEQVLIDLKTLTRDDINNASQAHDAIVSGAVKRSRAVYLLGYAHETNVTFDQVRQWSESLGCPENLNTLELEELLLSAEITSPQTLREGKRLAIEKKTTLARGLLMMASVTFPVLNCAFECLHLIKAGRISTAMATSALKSVRHEGLDLARALEKHGVKPSNTLSKIKVGDLLLAGKILSENQILEIVEKAIYGKQLIGEILVESGFISNQTLQEILLLQKFCQRSVIDEATAARLVKKSLETVQSIAAVGRQSSAFRDDIDTTDSAINLLFSADLASMNMVKNAVQEYQLFGMDPLKGLIADGQISFDVKEAAIECTRLLNCGTLTKEQAVCVLHYCDRNRVSYKDAFAQFDVSVLDDFKKTIEQAITLTIQEQVELPKFTRSIEFVLTIAAIIATSISVITAGVFKPEPLGLFAMPLIALLGICIMVALVFSYKLKVGARENERKSKAESIDQNMKRLAKLQQKGA